MKSPGNKSQTLDFELWTVDCGLWTVDFGLWTTQWDAVGRAPVRLQNHKNPVNIGLGRWYG